MESTYTNSRVMGGKREGAGRKPAHPLLKKEMISLKLPRWLIDRLDEEPESRAVMIETALREKHDWTPPDVGG
ncbi:MAG: hypothetical protein WC241_05020 [Candidatus Paceibacterota bacterium]